MGEIYDQYQLRMNPNFRDYIHTAVVHVANMIRHEDPATQFHDARAAMATKIIETNDPVVDAFVTKVVFRAVMEPTIRETVVQNGQMALAFANEGAVIGGIAAIWNETAVAVWPTIIEDTAPTGGE